MAKNEKLSIDAFFAERKEVLASYKTGQDPQLNLLEAVKYLKTIPAHKNFALKLAEAKKQGRTLVQPRAGVPVLSSHIELLQYLEASGADFVPSTIDSYTRQNRYNEAERGIKAKNWDAHCSTAFRQ